jgi:hypothetical protein
MKTRKFMYTKDNGDVSERLAVIVSEPRKNYLVYDISKLEPKEVRLLEDALKQAEDFRDNCLADFELLTGKKVNSLWRSFKPEGIEWITKDDV